MKPALDLSPLGTARPEVMDPFLAWLLPVRERLASSFGIEPEVSYLAWEVARWPAALDLEERQALALLILTARSVALQRQGSTRLPLQGDARVQSGSISPAGCWRVRVRARCSSRPAPWTAPTG